LKKDGNKFLARCNDDKVLVSEFPTGWSHDICKNCYLLFYEKRELRETSLSLVLECLPLTKGITVANELIKIHEECEPGKEILSCILDRNIVQMHTILCRKDMNHFIDKPSESIEFITDLLSIDKYKDKVASIASCFTVGYFVFYHCSTCQNNFQSDIQAKTCIPVSDINTVLLSMKNSELQDERVCKCAGDKDLEITIIF
jgi:hypothetical protein